jgi:AraC family transcriptional regulator
MSSAYQIYIKNMVCPRCIKVVQQELTALGYHVLKVDLGLAEILEKPDKEIISQVLQDNGFELLEDEKRKKIAQIKAAIVSLVHHKPSLIHHNLSDWLSETLATDYASLSQLFSSQENLTIEKFYILQRIEKVKELLVYDELSLKEIAFTLGFNSVAHLSAQFKKETGLTTGHFKANKHPKRKNIDSL